MRGAIRSYNTATRMCKNLLLVKDVISEAEEGLVMKYLSSILTRKKYEGNHWDDVIQQYKEIELSHYKVPVEVNAVVARIQNLIQDIVVKPVSFLPPHVIELSQDGFIGPHVDSIKFSGGFVAGLSLESTRIMALSVSGEEPSVSMDGTAVQAILPKENQTSLLAKSSGLSMHATNCNVTHTGVYFDEICPTLASASSGTSGTCALVVQALYPGKEQQEETLPALVELHVPPRSLYLLMGAWRYNYNHAILGTNQHPKICPPLSEPCSRRTSIIFRDTKS